MRLLTLSRTTFLTLFILLLSACGGSDDQVTTNPNDPVEPEPSELTVSASAGLNVSLDEGSFLLTVPANAVSQSTELTYEKTVLDDANALLNIISDIHALTPSTVSFSNPITITIKIPDDYQLGGQLFV